MDHDIIVGKITNILGEDTKLHIGDLVIYFFDFYEFKICPYDPFMSLCVDDYYLFKISAKINLPFILPVIKYGFLICVLLLLIENTPFLTIYSNYNVYNIIHKFIKKSVNINWKAHPNFNQLEDNCVIVLNKKWIIKIDNIEHIFDFNDNTIIGIFGRKNIDIVLKMCCQYKAFNTAGIFYIPFDDLNQQNNGLQNESTSRTRFFSIITFKSEN